MPVVSKAQNAAMHAAAAGKSTIGIPQSVGREFVEASHGEDVKALPQRKRPTRRRSPVETLMIGKSR